MEHEYKEVKRRAKEGEYVQIVSPDLIPTTNKIPDYKRSDILKILNIEVSGTARYRDGIGDNGYARVLNTGEYIVLEGYHPAFDWNGFKKGEFAVHCDTENKANAFLKECDEHEIVWLGGNVQASSQNYYPMFRENTTYICLDDKYLQVANYNYFEKSETKIIDYQPITPQEKQQEYDISAIPSDELIFELERRLGAKDAMR